jgi:hypothetical protein
VSVAVNFIHTYGLNTTALLTLDIHVIDLTEDDDKPIEISSDDDDVQTALKHTDKSVGGRLTRDFIEISDDDDDDDEPTASQIPKAAQASVLSDGTAPSVHLDNSANLPVAEESPKQTTKVASTRSFSGIHRESQASKSSSSSTSASPFGGNRVPAAHRATNSRDKSPKPEKRYIVVMLGVFCFCLRQVAGIVMRVLKPTSQPTYMTQL